MTIRDNRLYGVLCATSCGWQGETIHDLLAHRREAHGPIPLPQFFTMMAEQPETGPRLICFCGHHRSCQVHGKPHSTSRKKWLARLGQ